jgi:beta-lactamase regulating signal transducer with metallopeptidase domain
VSALVDVGLAAKGWLAMLGMMAAQGTVLAIIALVLTRAGKLRPAWQAAIWLVVAVKLALPWGPAMPWSLSDLAAMLTDSSSHAATFVLTDPVTRTTAAPVAWPAIGWIALACVWLVGAVVVAVRAIVVHRATVTAARHAPLAPPSARAALGSSRTRLVIGGPDVGPHVVGVLRPTIVVPPALLDDPALLHAVLLHELAHVRRLDAAARLVQIIASALMWWCPVVRLVHRKLELAREAACDAWALEAGGVARPAYARLLVKMASLRTPAHVAALAAPRALDARVKAVLATPARARMGHLHRLVVAAWALLALGGARSAGARGKTDVCAYTTEMAAALYSRFPDADVDRDGVLSRDEACGLQAELRRVPEERTSRISPEDEAQLQSLLAEPLCCNCNELETSPSPESLTCRRVEGAER